MSLVRAYLVCLREQAVDGEYDRVYDHKISVDEEDRRGTGELAAPYVFDLLLDRDEVIVEDECCKLYGQPTSYNERELPHALGNATVSQSLNCLLSSETHPRRLE